MEDIRTLNDWFLRFCAGERAAAEANEARTAEKEKLFRAYLAPRVGNSTCAELTDDGVSLLWEELAAEIPDRTGLFSVLALLREVFSYIEQNSEQTMPDLFLRRSFVTQEGLPEVSAYLLNDYLTRTNSRHNLCLWLVLHTSLPMTVVLRLRETHLSLAGDTLTVLYDRRTRVRKDVPAKKKYIGTLNVLLSETEQAWWRANMELYTTEENYLASGTAEPENRRRLIASLNDLAEQSGIDSLTLEALEKTEWDRSERDEEDLYFDDSAETDTEEEAPDAPETGEIFDLTSPIFTGGGEDKTPFDPARLDEMMSVFPAPVLEHARRTRAIAAFLLEHVRAEDWFLAEEGAEESLADAVYYHDLGKAALALDDYYSGGKIGSEQDARYRSHVEKGLQLFRSESPVAPEEYAADSFGGMLRDVLSDHHERVDGKGFPRGKKGDEISVAGRVASLADALDHKLFVSSNIDADPDAVLEELVKRAGTRYDARLVRVLTEHREIFFDFISELRAHYRGKRTMDAYGMRYIFHPYHDPADGKVCAMEAHLFLNDPYYGLLDSEIILPVMEGHPRYPTFTRLQLKRLCRLICEANEAGGSLPPLFVKVAVDEVTRDTFFTNLFRIFVNCGVRFRQLTVMVDEGDAIGSGADLSGVSDRCHMIGANFALCNFGGETTLLPSLGRIRPDAILLGKGYAETRTDPVEIEFFRNILNTAKKVGATVYCPGVTNAGQYRNLGEAGLAGVGGTFVAEDLTEGELLASVCPAEPAGTDWTV